MKGICFDLDGTLIDSMGAWQNLEKGYVESKGLEYDPLLTEKLKAVSRHDAQKAFSEFYNYSVSFDDMYEYMDKIAEKYYKEDFELKCGVREKLEQLKDKNFKMCITTATDSRHAMLGINRLGLMEYMDFVLTPDIAGCSKESVEFFEKALAKLQTKPENTYVFDDALYALENAEKLNLTPVGVHDTTSSSDEQAIKEISKIYLKDFTCLDVDLL